MRAGWPSFLLLSGCLAAPADPIPQPAGDASGLGAPDAPALHCPAGATLDLVYVDSFAIVPGSVTNIAIDGMAVFANPSEDTVVVDEVSASAVGGDPDIVANVALTGADDGFEVAPGEAKGALSAGAAAVVRSVFDESWADTEDPTLAAGFSLDYADVFEEVLSVDIPVQVVAGDYVFAIFVTLIPDGSKDFGAPISAARATANCP